MFMKRPTVYSLLIAVAVVGFTTSLSARPIGFSEISLMVRMHEPEAAIKDDVAQRKLLHPLTQPQESLLKTQGATDSLIQSFRNSNLVASKEEVAAAEAASARQASAPANEADIGGHRHHSHLVVFDLAFGHSI